MSNDPPSGEVRLLRTDDGVITVEHADPVVWFATHTLEDIKERPDPDPGWAFDGEYVTLDVANGRWVWKLTGRIWSHHYGPGTTDLVMAEAVWPD
jgi:hypothetical protein